MSEELKPCPFCGNEPAPYWKGVGCVTSGCLLNGLHLDADKWNRRARPAEAEGVSALDELLALYPFKIDKQAFVVNGGAPLMADGDDEFLSFKKVDAALGEIRRLAEQGRAALSAVTAERDRLESMLIQTTARHFAQEWKDHADDKKLDECLSEGIAMLEAERDRLRDAAGKAIAWLDAEQNESGVGINRRIKLCRDAENSLRAAMAAKEA